MLRQRIVRYGASRYTSSPGFAIVMLKVYATPIWMSSANVTVQRHGKPVVVLPTNALLGQQVALEEVDGPVMNELRDVATREPVALTAPGHFRAPASQLPHP